MLSDFLRQRLERANGDPHYRQLCRLLQQAILSGDLPAGRRLPASRSLAKDLGISRNTVTGAYMQLGAEGYVISSVGSGTYVAHTVPDAVPPLRDARPRSGARAVPEVRPLSARGSRLVTMAGAASQQWGAFHPGVPDLTQFPLHIWKRLQNKHWRRIKPDMLSYGAPGGYRPLRQALADYLRAARGVKCSPEQVIITSGSHQSLHLISQLLSDPSDEAWIEDPCYWGARNVFHSVGLKVRPIAVDAEGMAPSPAQLKRPPQLMFVSPSHQYPLGVVMSLARRRMLLEYARQHDSWIIEDDYDSEYRYGSWPLASLQGLDTGNRVLYLGTFSKILFPGMRLGYLVVPGDMAERFEIGLSELYREGQMMSQAILAEFIADGHFTSHIRRMRCLYGERRALLIEQVRREFGPAMPVSGEEAGLHLVAHLPPASADQALCRHALNAGVFTRALSHYYHEPARAPRGLLLGYACVPEEAIPIAFGKLARVITSSPCRLEAGRSDADILLADHPACSV